jgi:hypothetical protein
MKADYPAYVGHTTPVVVSFDANGLTSFPYVTWRWPGLAGYLVVPAGTCAVLTLHNGRRKVYAAGTHFLTELPSGKYFVQFVDVRRHRTPIPLTESLCTDGWRGGLALEVAWRVRDAAVIVDTVDPLGELLATAQACVRAVIEGISHDELLGGVSDRAMDADAITQNIGTRLRRSSAIQGLEIVDVLITDRQGDERRMEIVQETTVEQTQLAEQHRLELQRVSNEAAVLSKQRDLEQERRAHSLFEAETERMRIEEERKVQIREAEIEAQVASRLLPVRRQEVQLKLAAEMYHEHYELVAKALDAYAKILGEAAKMVPFESWGISSRRRPEFGFEGRDAALSEGLAGLRSLLSQPTLISGLDEVSPNSPPDVLLARLVAELGELGQMDEVQTWHIKPNDGGGYKIRVWCQDISLDIVCQLDYPSERPDVLVSEDGHGPREFTFSWAEGMSLKDIVLEATRCFAHPTPSSGEATWQPVA